MFFPKSIRVERKGGLTYGELIGCPFLAHAASYLG